MMVPSWRMVVVPLTIWGFPDRSHGRTRAAAASSPNDLRPWPCTAAAGDRPVGDSNPARSHPASASTHCLPSGGGHHATSNNEAAGEDPDDHGNALGYGDML
jgi:hypothetical protein